MLAHDLIPLLSDYELFVTDRGACDITDEDAVRRVFSEFSPDIVINCAAYTAVDDAEDIGSEINTAVNTDGVGILAAACAENASAFITISTDYVFDGSCKKGYLLDAETNPINAYGKAKCDGERLAFEKNPSSIIIRTSWLYGGWKQYKNFFNTMVSLSQKYDTLKVVDDQVWLPTYTVHLSQYIVHIINNIEEYKGRIVHGCNSGNPTSRYWFTKEIMRVVWSDVMVDPCGSDQYPTKAKRPAYSVLLSDDRSYTMPDWKEWVRAYGLKFK